MSNVYKTCGFLNFPLEGEGGLQSGSLSPLPIFERVWWEIYYNEYIKYFTEFVYVN